MFILRQAKNMAVWLNRSYMYVNRGVGVKMNGGQPVIHSQI